jgi:hypothetical protein
MGVAGRKPFAIELGDWTMNGIDIEGSQTRR